MRNGGIRRNLELKGAHAQQPPVIQKGQYITLENVFFFAIGITLVITIYADFSGISESLHSAALDNLLEKEGENIRANIVRVFLAGNSTNSSISLSFGIPRQLSGCVYKVAAVSGNLSVGCTEASGSKSLSLYGIETRVRNNALYSSAGRISVFYSDGSVLLG